MIKSMTKSLLSDQSYLMMMIIVLVLLGSHIFVHYLWIFILPIVFLIDWKKKLPLEVYLLLFFLISLYGIYIHENSREILGSFQLASGVVVEIVMIFLLYMMAIHPKISEKTLLSNEKKLFYLLYGFFIAYIIGIIYSYYFLPQFHPLRRAGFSVFYTYANDPFVGSDGKIRVTLVAYYLSAIVALVPFLVFNYKSFRERKFIPLELFLLVGMGLFSLYLASNMGRRMTVLLLLLVFIYIVTLSLITIIREYGKYKFFIALVIVIILFSVGYYYLIETSAIKRVRIHGGFIDPRYVYWFRGLECIYDYPFGGAANIPVINGIDPNAHNLWINIGKSFGIFAFIGSIVFYFIHFKYLIRIILNKSISMFMKNLILILTLVLFANMMVESIFYTEKTYFFYSIFFLGFLKLYSDSFSHNIENLKAN